MTAKPNIQVLSDPAALARAAAERFVAESRRALAHRAWFHVALSGGSTPKALFQTLARPPFRDEVSWSRVQVFWSDERCVPAEHADSNYGMACEALLEPVGLVPAQVHRMPADHADLDQAARDYQEELARVFGLPAQGPPPALDLVLLGLGTDGHTASLFPHTLALKETKRWVVSNHVPDLGVFRITLTVPMINRAACVLFLVQGGEKAGRVAEVLHGAQDPDRLPAQWIRPHPGELVWMLDRAAAAALHEPR